MRKLNLGILISGRGSNMESLIRACADPAFPARVAVVVANRPDAAGLGKAHAAGIPAETVDHKNFSAKADFEEALFGALQRHGPIDLVCLAGFMRLLSAGFIGRWPAESIVNIHPSLLPAYKGLDTHARALADGVPESGCSVHYVTPGMDEGPVILQRRVKVEPGDTPETLAERILAQEHAAYPEAVRTIAAGRLKSPGSS